MDAPPEIEGHHPYGRRRQLNIVVRLCHFMTEWWIDVHQEL